MGDTVRHRGRDFLGSVGVYEEQQGVVVGVYKGYCVVQDEGTSRLGIVSAWADGNAIRVGNTVRHRGEVGRGHRKHQRGRYRKGTGELRGCAEPQAETGVEYFVFGFSGGGADVLNVGNAETVKKVNVPDGTEVGDTVLVWNNEVTEIIKATDEGVREATVVDVVEPGVALVRNSSITEWVGGVQEGKKGDRIRYRRKAFERILDEQQKTQLDTFLNSIIDSDSE